jgi:hypothetical protein
MGTITPADILDRLAAAGATMEVAGNALRVRPRSAVTGELRALIRSNKEQLLDHLHLREAAGPDWTAIKDDDQALAALRAALEAHRCRQQGTPPPDYTQPARCAGCGPVLLWSGAPSSVQACPWCSNRAAGKPIPRPAER